MIEVKAAVTDDEWAAISRYSGRINDPHSEIVRDQTFAIGVSPDGELALVAVTTRTPGGTGSHWFWFVVVDRVDGAVREVPTSRHMNEFFDEVTEETSRSRKLRRIKASKKA